MNMTDRVEQLRADLRQLVNAARFSTTPEGRRDATRRAVLESIDNALDLINHHM